jgi:putative ABC transport system permease protein
LRAIGIKEQVIIASYILQAIFYAAAGTTMGLLLMYGLIDPYFARYPLDMPVGDVSLTIISSQMFQGLLGLQLAAVLAGYVPSRMATKENILKAIWG